MKSPKILVLLLLLALFGFAGCSQTAPPATSANPDTTPTSTGSATFSFTDACGRTVELPKAIERIAPSGPLAQIVLYTLCPDKIVGFASDISDKQYQYIDQKYQALPVFGNFYADTLNLESVMAAKPQVIIDIGEAKQTIVEDMDGIQAKTGIPTVFIQMEMASMSAAYQTLGELTGSTEQAQKLVDYISQTQADVKAKVATIPEDQRLKVFYSQDEGLNAVVKGTVHADVIDLVGGINVTDLPETLRGGIAEVSMEQLMLWNPDLILLAPNSIYDQVASRPEWQGLKAIQAKKYYEVPEGPYNWMGRPPSVNRILGIKWLANLLYPETFDYDMVQETKDFYRLFYHCDVTDAQINALLSKSTKRQ